MLCDVCFRESHVLSKDWILVCVFVCIGKIIICVLINAGRSSTHFNSVSFSSLRKCFSVTFLMKISSRIALDIQFPMQLFPNRKLHLETLNLI